MGDLDWPLHKVIHFHSFHREKLCNSPLEKKKGDEEKGLSQYIIYVNTTRKKGYKPILLPFALKAVQGRSIMCPFEITFRSRILVVELL